MSQPESERKRKGLFVRLTPGVIQLLRRRAKAQGLTVSAFLEELITTIKG